MYRGLNRGAGAAAAFVAVAVAAAGCNNDTPADPPAKSAKPTAALPAAPSGGAPVQTHYMSWPGKSFKVDLMGLDQVAPTRLVARFRVTAGQGSDAASTAWAAPSHAKDHAPSGLLLVDPAHATEYPVLRTAAGGCLCSEANGLKAGQSVDLDAGLPAPPAGAGKMIVTFPNTAPFLGIPVTAHSPYLLHAPAGGTALNPATAPTAAPEAYPLINTVQHGKEIDATSGGKLSVRLSSDVVFATNSATLTPTSRSLLQQVAAKIDKSTGSTVTVDGYADNTGTNAVNAPLSAKRAANVSTALRKLVTRRGIQYASAGHGSADPIADNGKSEGRALNRRVVITFAVPATAAGGTVPPATSDPAAQPNPRPVATVHATKSPIPLLPWPKSMTFDVNGLIREPNGFAVLTWTLHNTNKFPVPAAFATDLADVFRNAGPSRIVVGAGQDEYKNVEDSRQQAIFPAYSAQLGDVIVQPHDTLVGWNLFRLPATVTTVAVSVPGFPVLTKIHVQAQPGS